MNALRAFEAAARHLNFSRAADELSVTPGAVSQQIQNLEDYVGAALFKRTPKGLLLTDAAASGLGLTDVGLAHEEVYPDAGQIRGRIVELGGSKGGASA